MSNLEPIDFIDLTQDSPANKIVRPRRKCNSNDSIIEIESVRTNSHRHDFDQENQTLNAPMEIIDLDATTISEPSGTCVINQSAQGKELVVLTCPICLEKLSSDMKPTSTKCGHLYCRDCLQLALQKSRKCPSCQTTITLKSCTRLYF